MPQTKTAKRATAIRLYQEAITRHERSMCSGTTNDSAVLKIRHLRNHIAETKAK